MEDVVKVAGKARRGGTVGFAVNEAELGELLGFFECAQKELNKRVKQLVFDSAREGKTKVVSVEDVKEAVVDVGLEGKPASAATE